MFNVSCLGYIQIMNLISCYEGSSNKSGAYREDMLAEIYP